MTLLRHSGEPGTVADRVRRVPGEAGIWVFVLGDMTVFALFFATFMYSRGKNHAVFARDHTELHVALGTLNTVLLLSSSLLVALAVQRVLAGRHAGAWRLIAAALCCGAGFVAVKAIEWTQLFAARKGVGSGEFFSYYFMFTGIHLLHVLIGLAALEPADRGYPVNRSSPISRRGCVRPAESSGTWSTCCGWSCSHCSIW